MKEWVMLYTVHKTAVKVWLHPVSTGLGNIKDGLYLSTHTYDALELRLTR